jgi:hypothetical protein
MGTKFGYEDKFKYHCWRFNEYRNSGDDVGWTIPPADDAPWRNYVLPQPYQGIYPPNRDPGVTWDEIRREEVDDTVNLDEIADGGQLSDQSTHRQAWDVLQEAKSWFASPNLAYQKLIGYGGMGLVIHYKYNNPQEPDPIRRQRSFVVKVGLEGPDDDDIRQEARSVKVRMTDVYT